MRLASILHQDRERIGLVADDESVGLLPESFGDMVDLIESGPGASGNLEAHVEESVTVEPNQWLAPIRRFRRDILCTGWNYWAHFEENIGKRGAHEVDRPTAPTFFSKAPDTVISPHASIGIDPHISAKWDYEVELAVVFGRTARSIHKDEAMDHIFGFFLANDVSQRDLQQRHGGQWLKGKSIDATMPMGPWITTANSVDLNNVSIECSLNGETMQSARIGQMAFPLPELIAELSFGMTLHAGDVLITGTPHGVGMAREPAVFMKAGDKLVSKGTGLGELRNELVLADLHGQTSMSSMSDEK